MFLLDYNAGNDWAGPSGLPVLGQVGAGVPNAGAGVPNAGAGVPNAGAGADPNAGVGLPNPPAAGAPYVEPPPIDELLIPPLLNPPI